MKQQWPGLSLYQDLLEKADLQPPPMQKLKNLLEMGDSDFNSNISQCLLITDLANIGKYRKKLRADSKTDIKPKDPNTWSYPLWWQNILSRHR